MSKETVKISIVSMEIESDMMCEKCGKPTIFYIFDSTKKEICFYPEPHLNEAEIKHSTGQMKRVPSAKSDKYDVLLFCPVCGIEIAKYKNVPLDWTCLDTPNPITVIPIKELKPYIIDCSDEFREKDKE